MRAKRLFVAVGLVAGGLMLGYVFGPAAAGGVTGGTVSPVHIQDRDSGTNADVTSKHRLSVDSEASITDLGDNFLDTFGLQYQLPNGQDVLANTGSGCSKVNNDPVVLASVNINMTAPQANVVTVTVESGGGQYAYQTTFDVNEVGSRDFSFDGGVYFSNGFKVVTSPNSNGLSCEVIGQDLGVQGGQPTLHATK
jgi:hypothetical protein